VQAIGSALHLSHAKPPCIALPSRKRRRRRKDDPILNVPYPMSSRDTFHNKEHMPRGLYSPYPFGYLWTEMNTAETACA
jgi:hypothetical protein